jgi:hypothetical protein
MLCKRLKFGSVPAHQYFNAMMDKLEILELALADACSASAQKLMSQYKDGPLSRRRSFQRPAQRAEGCSMRFLFGIIVGILLTVGSAYLFDNSRGGEGVTGRMVNWDVVQAQLKILSSNIQDGWSRLTGRKTE